MKLCLGLDIGGTKIEAALLQNDGNNSFKVIKRERIPTLREEGFEKVYSRMKNLILNVVEQSSFTLREVQSIGLGLPGTVEPKSSQMLQGNTAIFVGQDLRTLLARDLLAYNFKGTISIANDANCFALAEALLGAGLNHALKTDSNVLNLTSIGIILGTGVGGGLIVNGKILIGKNGGAGEIGHLQLDPTGPACYCGRRGCVELFLSGKGFETWYFEKMGEKISSQEIFKNLAQKNSKAENAWKIYVSYLDAFLLDLNNFFDPDFMVLGGGVSLQSAIYDGLEERLWKNTFVPNGRPRIYKNVLGDSAGVIGAALL